MPTCTDGRLLTPLPSGVVSDDDELIVDCGVFVVVAIDGVEEVDDALELDE